MLISGFEGWNRTIDARFLPPLYHLSYIITILSPGLEIRSPITLSASACAFSPYRCSLFRGARAALSPLARLPVVDGVIARLLRFLP